MPEATLQKKVAFPYFLHLRKFQISGTFMYVFLSKLAQRGLLLGSLLIQNLLQSYRVPIIIIYIILLHHDRYKPCPYRKWDLKLLVLIVSP